MGLQAALAAGGGEYRGPGRGPASRDAHADEVHPHSQALKNPDGSWKYTNRLAHEISPYLLLHAHNPVDWYPWGEEALERAREEDKPIFLSVGYSTCYWCHVMERLVFSDPQIAALMNQWFVNIKVDREERPDLDEIYMTATQLITGGGGWPNSVFLTPDLRPFYAGTYFPPEDRFNIPGFPKVLRSLRQIWEEQRPQVEQQADQLTAAIRQSQEAQGAAADSGALKQALVDEAVQRLKGRFDNTHGGFGGAPKFPPDMDLELLMAEYGRTGEKELLDIVTHTLEQMARGGIHDHLGGGFHRYATDSRWRVPHFEKMLYNQAPLAKVYLQAYQLTGREELRQTAEDIFGFVSQVMKAPEGGFYSALDSETDGIEGKYYLWTEEEIRQVLGEQADLFLKVYGLAPMPEGEGAVLYMPRSLEESAGIMGMSEAALSKELQPLKETLLRARQERPLPLLDTKILTAWNGLMIDAYAYGYEVLGEEAYLQIARQAAALVLERLRDGEGQLQRSFREGTVKYAAYQEDYAFLARGLLGLYRATEDARYLERAEELAKQMVEQFWDEQQGGFYLTSGTENLIARTKSPYDSATPSGNSEAAHVLLELGRINGKQDYLDRARRTMQAFAGAMQRGPGEFSRMMLAVEKFLHPALGTAVGQDAAGTAPAAQEQKVSSLAALLSNLNPSGKGADTLLTDSAALVQAEPFVSADRLVPGETFQVAARLKVTEHWHINANPASFDFLIPTTLQVNSDLPVEVLSVDYPPSAELKSELAEESLAVYSGEVVILATLRLNAGAAPGSKGWLRLQLRYQACDDRRCLAPAQVELPLEVEVAGRGEHPTSLHPELFGAE
ncbi:MAG: thioredoxin domain-containing protein [Candidatus Latescibacteria bacterium]|nr:thioredoxin domain-containing protein [Candidatus Latescibacterota bacterium]